MRNHLINSDEVYAVHVRLQEVRLEVQRTRWQAAQIRHTARLLRLQRRMPGANSLTLALSAVILAQRGLWTEAPLQPPSSAPPSASLI
jgi:hypothetical protein